MTPRQQALMRGEFPVMDHPTLPRPETEVVLIGENTAMVRSSKHLGEWRVVELVQAKKAGNWIFPIEWRNTIEEKQTVKPNPHKNTDGYWVWLLKMT